mgnify:CR=1 FL=1
MPGPASGSTPGRLAHLRSNLPELAKHVLEDADSTFASRVKAGDFIAASSNFGLGSSREHAPLVIKMAGVSAVLAKSAARIFFRNCINLGLLPLECPSAVEGIEAGDEVCVDPVAGKIENISRGVVFDFKPLPPFLEEIIAAGDLTAYVRRQLSQGQGR